MNRPEVPDAALPILWTALAEDSGADAAIMNGEGRVLWVKLPISWWVARLQGEEIVGRTMHDLFGKEIADERLDLVRRVLSTGKPLVLYGAWRGVRTRTVIRPLPTLPGQEPRVLTVCRGPVPADRNPTKSDTDVVHAKFVDPGQLGKLTPRELEILAMIAQGMTTAAIAKKLFRSRKTIEAHRLSMGAKLGVRNRVELARIALEAGLLSGPPQPVAAAAGNGDGHLN